MTSCERYRDCKGKQQSRQGGQGALGTRRQRGPRAVRRLRRRPFARSCPLLCECSVQVTVVDLLGRRHVVRGTTGQSVVELLQAHLDTLGEDGEQGLPGRRLCLVLPTCITADLPVTCRPPRLPAAVCLSPEGRDARESHIKIPTELMAAFPAPTGDDARLLEEIAESRSLDGQ